MFFAALVHFYILDRCTRKELKNYCRVFMHATGLMKVDRVKYFCRIGYHTRAECEVKIIFQEAHVSYKGCSEY